MKSLMPTFHDTHTKDEVKPVVLVCGSFDVLPSKPLEFVLIESLRDLVTIDVSASGRVYSIARDACQALQAYESYPSLFDFQLIVLSGVPDCNYENEFEMFTAFCPRISYSEAMTELEAEAIREAALRQETIDNGSIYDKEVSTRTRKNGNVKVLEDVEAPSMVGLNPNNILREEGSDSDDDQ